MLVVDNMCVRVTSACNLDCLHCRAPKTSMTKHLDLQAFVSFVCDLKSFGLAHISLSGGEPLLYPLLHDMIDSCRDAGIGVALTTNGTLRKELIDLLSRFSNTKDILVKISVDGNKRRHDTLRGDGVYSKAISSLSLVSQSDLRTGINTVIKEDYTFISSIYDDVKELHIDQWAMITFENRYRRQTTDEIDLIVSNTKTASKFLKNLGYSGSIKIWDFLSHPNGGILVDVEGNILMPSFYSKDDILIGNIYDYDKEMIAEAISIRLKNDPIAFFTQD